MNPILIGLGLAALIGGMMVEEEKKESAPAPEPKKESPAPVPKKEGE